MKQVKDLANKYGLRTHLDGARVLNAAAYLKTDPRNIADNFNTVNLCLSKGLGCPVGSMVIGTKEDVNHARIMRKILGGAMRQAGILASCGLIALENW